MRWKFIFRVSRDNSLAQGLRRRRGFHLIRGGTPHPARFAAHLSRLPARSALLSLRTKVSTGDPRPSRGRLRRRFLPTRSAHLSLRSKVSAGDPRPSKGKALGDGEGRADEKAPGGRASSGAVHNAFFI